MRVFFFVVVLLQAIPNARTPIVGGQAPTLPAPEGQSQGVDETHEQRLKQATDYLVGEWKLTIFGRRSSGFFDFSETFKGPGPIGDKDTKKVAATAMVTFAAAGTFSLRWDDAKFQPTKDLRDARNPEALGTWVIREPNIAPVDQPAPKATAFTIEMVLTNGHSLFWEPNGMKVDLVQVVEVANRTENRWEFRNGRYSNSPGGLIDRLIFDGPPRYGAADSSSSSLWRFDRVSPKPAPAVAAQGRKAVELRVGMTEAEALAGLGEPQRKLTLADRTVLQYSDLVITIVNGKVTDIQVR